MSRQKRSIYLGMMVISIALIIDCSTVNIHSPQAPISQAEYIDICQITKDVERYSGTVIRIRGSIKGFHELVLYSDNCPGESNLVQAKINFNLQRDLVRQANLENTGKADIQGEIFLTGKFEKDGGRLSEYEQAIDAKQTNAGTKTLNVSQLMDVRIDCFIPQSG